jgi:D-3-phosphoglycerate dehydrogenase
VVGFGRIGRRVAGLARAFGMSVAAHDPLVPPEALARAQATPAPNLAGALAEADFVTLHLPPTPGGPLIGAHELSLMKPTAILVNAARGGLVDEAALDAALRAGRLFGAGLDVLEAEPPRPEHPLLSNPRVTLSPHAAGLTGDCAARMATAAAQNILDCFAGTLDRSLVVNADAIGLGA